MAERPSHKRTKSALALSLVNRVKSRTERDPNAPSSATTSDNESTADSPLTDSPTTSNASPLSQFRTSRSKTQLAGLADPPRSNPAAGDAAETSSNPHQTTDGDVAASGLGQKDMSIEQSVRTFRIFEALRSGDTSAISKAIKESGAGGGGLQGTTVLHLAIQCADPPVVEYVLSTANDAQGNKLDINATDKEGNTPIHLAAQLGRAPIVHQLLEQEDINDSVTNYRGQTPLDLARTPEIFQQLQLARSIFLETKTKEIHSMVTKQEYESLEKLLVDPRVEAALDVNNLELATDLPTVQTGGTLLHEAARKRDTKLAQILLMHGADPFRRDRKGKLPQDVTKDDRTRGILKKSPAAVIAQRGIQEKAILGNTSAQRPGLGGSGEGSAVSKDGREMKGYLKKWTNYTSGYKLRWFVLEDGVLSYYKHQDDAGSACRGAINMRIARLHMDAQDKTRFEIHGKSSVKYHLKANHVVEAKRWFWALNNAIQWTKDEAREDEKRQKRDAELLRQAKEGQSDKVTSESTSDVASMTSGKSQMNRGLTAPVHTTASKVSFHSVRSPASAAGDDEGSQYDSYEPSMIGQDMTRMTSNTAGTTTLGGEGDEEEEYGDDASSHELQPVNKDAFNITAQSAKVQLDLLAQISGALQKEKLRNPGMVISDPIVDQALSAHEAAIGGLNNLIVDLLKISRDRDAFWQYRLDREADARKMWEDSMARVAKEHEELQEKIGESEDKRKRTKRALKEALETATPGSSRPASRGPSQGHIQIAEALDKVQVSRDGRASMRERRRSIASQDPNRRKSVIAQFTDLSDSESGDDEEFFDAVDAGEVEVIEELPLMSPPLPPVKDVSRGDLREEKKTEIVPSFRGYEDPVRKKMKLDADNRPKISLWGILKSMIGKDMTKMTLPVSFNEPTSLLQRVAEDMEYADLLDIAADRTDSTERMVYVAAFAASEYASTIGRVAKPFNPLLGETYEYVRPDKNYRFFIEQVSHHPPIGAAWAESPRWEYYGESAVKSKFYGRSFDINPLGTWFLKLRPINGGPPELYTWKKVTSSVVGIITGNPTVDNYGPMEVKNWTTGELCILDFKQRGWKASSAFQVTGKVMDADGKTRWSIGGRWNDKIYARLTPGFEGAVEPPVGGRNEPDNPHQAFLVWEAHSRPTGIPFNLTPFVVTLNAIPDTLRPHLPPTDTRLRPDQRAMEDGEYDLAATEKNRVEEKQRAKRRQRENHGEEFVPQWFTKGKCEITGEEYWVNNREYWKKRAEQNWEGCEDIF